MFVDTKKTPDCFLKKIHVKESSIQGLGVFAIEAIDEHELFESCTVILFNKSLISHFCEETAVNRHLLDDYVFAWSGGNMGLALGYGSVYNHSNKPNVTWRAHYDAKDPYIEFTAKRKIEAGEELFIHYLPRAGVDLEFDQAGTFFPVGEVSNSPASKRAMHRRLWTLKLDV